MSFKPDWTEMAYYIQKNSSKNKGIGVEDMES